MIKKIVAGVVVVIVVAVAGLYFWAQSILATESVRTAIAAQVSKAIGQPVTIGGIGATVFPRVTVNLEQVAIGQPPRIQVGTLAVGTSFGALLSRRIEHGSLRLDGARIEMPLPPIGAASADAGAAPGGESGGAPVEIVSIDEIVLSNVEIVSGGRTLRGDIEAVLDGQRVELRKIELGADGTHLSATGTITDFAGPIGELTITAGTLDIDQLLAFATEFAGGAQPASGASGAPERAPRAAAAPSTMDLTVALDAEHARMGGLTLDALTGRARLTPDTVAVDPMAFGVFGGRYEGAMSANVAGATPSFRWTASLSGVDVAAATAFAGSPDTVSGRLSGKIDLAGTGADAATAIKTVRGTARVDVVDGVVKKLGLLRGVVIATSMREGAMKQASGGSTDEPFTRLGATIAIANRTASTEDLRFESKDLLLNAAGTVRLETTEVHLAGKVQLTEELSKQAGSDLLRYTAEQGRVTLPATITGPASSLSVRIDVADMAKRAITNRATEEAQKRLKGLGGLIRRP
jgi:uncharacterized protein involved in outer membrane biogenesis